MTAYYNEIDPYAAQWLRNLIEAGHIAAGVVDDRSIEDVTPGDLRGFTQCHFFAGIGVWSYALRQAGWSDDRPAWTGSCPCQPFSDAGKSAGFDDERHLWPAFFHLIEKCRPSIIFGEQVASKDGLTWLDLVQTDLEGKNYATAANDLCSAGFGATNIRQRLYWVAHSENMQVRTYQRKSEESLNPSLKAGGRSLPATQLPGKSNGFWADSEWLRGIDGRLYPVEPGTLPLVDGDTKRVGRISALGNAINAEVAKGFIEAYMEVQHA
ncbi:DNA cytosine methyltransferase [Pantoea agglomerans]|uniref:DNA cytosine methyltransferase n=1 Tax=Enterobacter agglomerans TaxID=549 RepID=UPI001CBAA344|nr:DNA cytosine methyltransferase [Pantoea agglomerans]